MSEICRCVNAVRVLPCLGVEAGVTIGYNAEVVEPGRSELVWGRPRWQSVCGRLYKIVPQIPFLYNSV